VKRAKGKQKAQGKSGVKEKREKTGKKASVCYSLGTGSFVGFSSV